MNIVHITPGAGGMYCGNCFRDNALVEALRKYGHTALMVPLYLPLTLDDTDQSAGTPVFFGGINVYLDQKFAMFRKSPRWLRGLLARPALLRWAGGRAAKTRANELGDLTLSMLRGEEGNQVAELDTLMSYLRKQPRPDVICLSNALLIGLVPRLKSEFSSFIICNLQGEDTFLDSLPQMHQPAAWRLIQERARDVDLFVAPSRYFADVMTKRLQLNAGRVQVIYNGIKPEGFSPAASAPNPPVLGFFARMCREKGLDTLVDAFLILKQRNRARDLRLHAGGSLSPSDQPFVAQLRKKLAPYKGFWQFFPNLSLEAKQDFYRSLTVMSVPALYGEAFGLYIIEALACAVPVVQPAVAAFPEIIAATGGGILSKGTDPESLADAIEPLLGDMIRTRGLGNTGRQAVLRDFTAEAMARNFITAMGSRKLPQQPARV
jgi:glycosyltransferase involved in cell wall biosynthesis